MVVESSPSKSYNPYMSCYTPVCASPSVVPLSTLAGEAASAADSRSDDDADRYLGQASAMINELENMLSVAGSGGRAAGERLIKEYADAEVPTDSAEEEVKCSVTNGLAVLATYSFCPELRNPDTEIRTPKSVDAKCKECDRPAVKANYGFCGLHRVPNIVTPKAAAIARCKECSEPAAIANYGFCLAHRAATPRARAATRCKECDQPAAPANYGFCFNHRSEFIKKRKRRDSVPLLPGDASPVVVMENPVETLPVLTTHEPYHAYPHLESIPLCQPSFKMPTTVG